MTNELFYQSSFEGTPSGYSPVKQAVQWPFSLFSRFLCTAFLRPSTLKYSRLSASTNDFNFLLPQINLAQKPTNFTGQHLRVQIVCYQLLSSRNINSHITGIFQRRTGNSDVNFFSSSPPQ